MGVWVCRTFESVYTVGVCGALKLAVGALIKVAIAPRSLLQSCRHGSVGIN